MNLVEDEGVITRKIYEELPNMRKTTYWQIGKNKFKLIKNLDDEHLQKVFYHAQAKELSFHNRYLIFNELTEQIEAEATGRGISLSDIDTDYHRKIRKYKSKTSDEQRAACRVPSDKV